jgi:hypothetical protein
MQNLPFDSESKAGFVFLLEGFGTDFAGVTIPRRQMGTLLTLH